MVMLNMILELFNARLCERPAVDSGPCYMATLPIESSKVALHPHFSFCVQTSVFRGKPAAQTIWIISGDSTGSVCEAAPGSIF